MPRWRLENGDIDILSGMSKTTEREEKFLFSATKMCSPKIAVQVRADEDRFTISDPSSMSNMTCGILQKSNVVTLYQNWCAQYGLTPHIIEYESIDARNAALAAKEVDAIAGGSTVAGAQKLAEFPSLDLYFMFNSSRSDLKEQLDRSMAVLSLENPTFAQTLFNRYFPSSRNSTPSFSKSEKQYITDHNTVKVALLADDAPFSETAKDGTMTGILPEYYAHLAAMTGLSIQCVPYADVDAEYNALNSQDVELIGKVENDLFSASARGILLSNSYASLNLVQLTKAGSNSIQTAAVPRCNERIVKNTLSDAGSDIQVDIYSNGEECFQALRSGKADAVIFTQPAATWMLNRNRASEYVLSAFGSSDWGVSFGLSSGTEGNTLRSILDKTIAVDSGYLNQLIASDMIQDSADLSTYLRQLPVSTIIAIALIAAVLLVIVVIALITLIRRGKTEKALAARKAQLAVAEEANKMRHSFFGAVSHDMRTPLNGIIGFTDLALENNNIDEVHSYLQKIRRSGDTLSSLVNDTLTVSRLENGTYAIVNAPVDLAEMMKGVVEPVQQMADKKGVRFADKVSGCCRGWVLSDRVSLQKVFLNLLTNAVKFSSEGDTVTFACHKEDTDSVFTVQDEGRGISEEFLAHIFEPFAQEDPSNARASGSGLGLSIVKSIVDAMGGSIDVKSQKEQGTVFTVRLHLESCAAPVENKASIPVSAVLNGKHVLVCEDNELNMEIVATILENAGMQVTKAVNGQEGLQQMAASPEHFYDCILLDLRMPVMDGISAARAIRALDRSDARTIPMFAVSADAYKENIQEALDAGMNGHISKPVNADELLQKLTAALTTPANKIE
jgi:signal transduction histidine kinase/ActR/RegA family two-component response regulator